MQTLQTKETLTLQASNFVSAYLKSIQCEKDGHLFEHFYNLTVTGFASHEEYGSICYQYETLCQQLLILLTNPEVSSLLPEYSRKGAGVLLGKLVDFFNDIGDGATEAAVDLERLAQYSDYYTEDQINRISEKYDEALSNRIQL